MVSAYGPTPVVPAPRAPVDPPTARVPAPAWTAAGAHPVPGPHPVVAPWPGPHVPGAFGQAGTAPAGVPPHLAFALAGPARPGVATAAGVLWIVLGVLELFWAAAVFGFGTGLPVLVPLLATATGIATVGLSAAMLSGFAGARTAVVVLGGLSLVMVLPVLLWVPAVVLQLHPAALAWSADAARRRRACRRG